MTRSAIFDALLTVLSAVADFETVSRRFQLWNAIPESERPALLLWEPSENYEWKMDVGVLVRLKCEIYCYLTPPTDKDKNPIDDLDDLLDKIDTALAPTTGTDKALGRFTLSGLCHQCRIEGEVVKASGDLTNISVLIVPISILVAQRTV